MTNEEREAWTVKRAEDVLALNARMSDERCRHYLNDISRSIVGFASDAGATDWPANFHLGDVIDKHIRRSRGLINASDGYWQLAEAIKSLREAKRNRNDEEIHDCIDAILKLGPE